MAYWAPRELCPKTKPLRNEGMFAKESRNGAGSVETGPAERRKLMR